VTRLRHSAGDPVARWTVVEVRCYEVAGPATEAEAIDAVRELPDLAPVSRELSAELLDASVGESGLAPGGRP
jgi:hypothetical protein